MTQPILEGGARGSGVAGGARNARRGQSARPPTTLGLLAAANGKKQGYGIKIINKKDLWGARTAAIIWRDYFWHPHNNNRTLDSNLLCRGLEYD